MIIQHKCPNCGAAFTMDTWQCDYCGSSFEKTVASAQTPVTLPPAAVVQEPVVPRRRSQKGSIISFIIGLMWAYSTYNFVTERVDYNAFSLIVAGPCIIALLTIPLAKWAKSFRGLVYIFMGILTMVVYYVSFKPFLKGSMESTARWIILFFVMVGALMVLGGIFSLINREKKVPA